MEVDARHPNPQPNLHHRKIELQSPHDLTYLQTHLLTSAQQKLDLHFPPSALRKTAPPATHISLDGAPTDAPQSQSLQPQPQQPTQTEAHDPLRTKVQDLVNTFLQRTWTSAAENITINGLDATSLPSTSFPPNTNPSLHNSNNNNNGNNNVEAEREGVDFTYTPYDARLQQRVAGLYAELESLTAQVSKLRREAPARGAGMYADGLKEEMEREDEKFEVERERQQQLLQQQQQRQRPVGRDGNEERERRVDQAVRQDELDILALQPITGGSYADLLETYDRGVSELSRLAGVKSRTEFGGGGGADSGAANGSGNGSGGSSSTTGGSLTETVGKVQRARTVAMEFE